MRKTIAALAISAGFLLGVAPIWAHHAFSAEFDDKKPIKLHGIVTQWELVNPHSWIHIDVKNPDGTVTPWIIEGGSPNALSVWDSPEIRCPRAPNSSSKGIRRRTEPTAGWGPS